MTKDIETISLGRDGRICSDGRITLEVQRFAGNRPFVEMIVGVDAELQPRLKTIYPYDRPRTGGGNGSDKYIDIADGLYRISDILDTGSRCYVKYILLENGKLREFEINELDGFFKKRFPSDWERMMIARSLLSEIAEERKLLAGPVVDHDLIAIPEFRDLPCIAELVGAMCVETFDQSQCVMKHSVPVRYVINQPFFCKASSPAQAFATMRALIEIRETQLDEAKKDAETAGWPALKGSPKQISWAETIRAKVAEKEPNSKLLKTATTAKYWIENYRSV